MALNQRVLGSSPSASTTLFRVTLDVAGRIGAFPLRKPRVNHLA